ncbi:MAG: C1 family peptidase, partial [Bacteroidales bacterium]
RQLYATGKKANELSGEKINILKDVYRVLALCLGEPPTEFTWKYKTKDGEVKSLKTTPKEFYKEVIPAEYNPQNYIMIMNDPTREYYKVYEIKNYRNSVEGVNWTYLNLPNEEIKPAALASIKGNEAIYGSCDVGKQNYSKVGIADPNMYDFGSLLGIKYGMDKKARILTRQSGSSHAMLIMACDTDDNDTPIKWQFENSWGAAAGHNGYLTFTDKWFDEYMFRVVLNKKYLSPKAQKAATEKPIMLPVWDYMF